jgi:hypothetical protein
MIMGMGLAGLTSTGQRTGHFRHILTNLGTHPRGSAAWMAEAFLKTTNGDPVALNLLLDSFVDTPEAVLRGWDLPVGIICGVDDDDNGSAEALAVALPRGELFAIPGNHMSAVIKPELGDAIRTFLAT